MTTNVMDKIIATQNKGAGCYQFGVYDTLEKARKEVADELGIKTLDKFMEKHFNDVGKTIFFESVREYVESYESNGDPYDPSGENGFRDREHLIQTVLKHRGT